MRSRFFTRAAAATATAGLALALTACGMDDDPADDEATGAATEDAMTDEMSEDSAADWGFGPACSAVPADGEGSFDGMADDPVATAAGNNPVLSTLVTAVGAADLGDTLNSAEDITVFAPTNDAFAAIPEEDLQAVLDDQELLTSILTYHVVGDRLSPSDLETGGPFPTLQGGQLELDGSGEQFTVNGDADVVCGNVQTANATVYIIDAVLMP